jgi:hypothetical protein
MSNESKPTKTADEQLPDTPSSDNIASRAEGRPPEESSSENPPEQAAAILQESEDRTAEGAAGSEPNAE